MDTPMDNPYLENLGKALEQWTDNRVLSHEDLRAMVLFDVYMLNLAEADGWSYDGHSITIALPMSRLVVRGTLDGIPHVVFSSGRTTTACKRAFLRKMEEGWLEWQVDRYRT